MFVSAHIIRRHMYTSDLYMSSSPIHDHYRTETEKLYNEIKNLKERLNETERVIRNESERVSNKKTLDYDKNQPEKETENSKYSNKSEGYSEYKGYQEEIKNLKTMLFDEIHNLRQKEKAAYDYTSETNVEALINKQEKEFQKLKDQLLEKLTPNIENMHAKLCAQENYWMSKIEQLENQHYQDIERLTTELKLTQKAADDMKVKYEAKVSDLEHQTAKQSDMLIEQNKQLHSLSHEINVSQINEKNIDFKSNSSRKHNQSRMLDQSNAIFKKSTESSLNQNDIIDTKVEQIILGNSTIDTTMSSSLSSKVFPLTKENRFLETTHSSNSKENIKQKGINSVKNTKLDHVTNFDKDLKYSSSSDISDSDDLMPEEGNNYTCTKNNNLTITELSDYNINKIQDTPSTNTLNKYLSNIKNKKPEDNLSSVSNSESSISDSSTKSVNTIHNNSLLREHNTHSIHSLKNKKPADRVSFHKKLQASLKEAFEQKLRDLGIDPEWQGIPKATFKQKMDILKHHHKLATKKSPKYHQTKLKIIEEIRDKIYRKGKVTEDLKQMKKSPSHRVVTNIKSTNGNGTMKVNNQEDSGNHVPTLQTVISNKFHSVQEYNHSIEDIIEDKQTLTKAKKSGNYKTIERIMQFPTNSIKSLEDLEHTINPQEHSTRKDSLSKIKPADNSETLKIMTNDRDISNNKSIQKSMDNSNIQQELKDTYASPKHNKSVLKSMSTSKTSLTKKKVLFDLADERDSESPSDDDMKKEQLNDSNWNTSRKHLFGSEDYKNSSTIILKTAQSDKIAELSRKLEAQLNMVRQKPAGSIETIFSSKYIQNKENQNKNNEQINSTDAINSLLDNQLHIPVQSISKKTNNSLPQPAPRNIKDKTSETLYAESISEISDLDSDIDKILKLE
ncbi:DAZ interacting zinc finger protein 1 isoform X2 [Xylocopa sonorina]